MNYCLKCGSPEVSFKVPKGDTHNRFQCDACGYIHYENPRNITGCILSWQSQILLCRRAIEPRVGLWTIPAGFMENGETLDAAAAREAHEEANAVAANLRLHSIHSLPHINQVYAVFHGELAEGQHHAGEESLETRLFTQEQIPWDQLAFSIVKETLQMYFNDKHRVHSGNLIQLEDGSFQIQ